MQKYAPVLTPRLAAVAEFIPPCCCFADIGTDHAYLPVYLCMKKRCERAIASDINKGPLERAEKTISEYGLKKMISLRLGGGFDTLESGEAEAFSIAGMGGLVIAKILEDGRDKLTPDCTVVLQPMTAVPELREYLYKSGWTIIDESLAREDEKIYNIIAVKLGEDKSNPPTEAEMFIGRELINKRPPHFEEYLERRIKKLENMVVGLSSSSSDESQRKSEKCKKLLRDIKELV